LKDGTVVTFDQYLCTRVGCQKVARQAEPIESIVNKIIEGLLAKVEIPEDPSVEDDDLINELERLKQKKAEIRDNYLSGSLSMADFMDLNPRVDRQIEDLDTKMARSAAVVQKPELIDQLRNGTASQKRAVIKLFIDYIAIKPAGHGRKFDVSQIEVVTKKTESKDSPPSEG
ncbi:MAG: hypothetical protein ACK8QZ_07640, partial [Anaerolineales bacterium]